VESKLKKEKKVKTEGGALEKPTEGVVKHRGAQERGLLEKERQEGGRNGQTFTKPVPHARRGKLGALLPKEGEEGKKRKNSYGEKASATGLGGGGGGGGGVGGGGGGCVGKKKNIRSLGGQERANGMKEAETRAKRTKKGGNQGG